MGCNNGKALLIDENKQTYNKIREILHEVEIKALQLIYLDLSSRNAMRRINLENFLLFFQKNGFWGDLLFHEFDLDKSDLLNLDEFIIGIARIFKSDESNKIMMLYRFFSGNDNDGIPLKSFLRLLYNYPKQDLKNIIQDRHFFETAVKNNLKNIRESQRRQDDYNRKTNTMFMKLEEEEQEQQSILLKTQHNLQESYINQNHQSNHENHAITAIMNSVLKKAEFNTMVLFKFEDQKYEVRTTSIHQLVKRFAEKVYKDYKVDIKYGKLKKEDFIDWIKKHNNLYNDYYSSFHGEVWGCYTDPNGIHLSYIKEKGEMKSLAFQILHKNKREEKQVKVGLKLINTILVVHDEKKEQILRDIICLEGLIVDKIFDDKYGFGFAIKHRDGIYTEKIFYVSNEPLLNQWMDFFKYYKGETFMQKYTSGVRLGIGKFSVVYQCIENATSKKYAVKEVETYKMESETRELIAQQSNIIKLLNHPFLLKFKESIQTRTHLYIITELVKGRNLFEFVKSHGSISEFEAALIAQQIITGVIYLHKLGIVHRDLKPENILIEGIPQSESTTGIPNLKNIKIRIIDFGFANYLDNLQCLQFEKLVVGTPNYIAPQVLKQQKLSFKIDNFAIGSTLFYMLSGKFPFMSFSVSDVLHRTLESQPDFDDYCWKQISVDAKDLVNRLLMKNPDQRISLGQALKHKWFKSVGSLNDFNIAHIDSSENNKSTKKLSLIKLTSAHVF